MKSLFVAGMLLCMLSFSGAALSGTEVSTNSFLRGQDTDFSALRSIIENQISTPDLKLISNARINTEILMENGGSCGIFQNSLASAKSNPNSIYEGLNSVKSSTTATGVKQLETNLKFEGSLQISNPWGDVGTMSKVAADCMGMSMASAGTGNYAFSMSSAQKTYSNGLILRPEKWRTEEPKQFSVSMGLNPMQFENPANKVDENFDLEFAVSDNNLDGLAYEFSRSIEMDDITFVSDMEYMKMGGVDES